MRGKRGVNQSNLHMAMISHELRNALSGSAGLGQQLAASGLTPEQLHLVHALQQSTRQMCWLVDALGREGENVQFPLSPRIASVHGIELLEQLIRSHLVPALEKGILLLLKVAPGIPPAWRCDERLLRLVLENLLGNAIKHGGSGEITLEVGAAETGLIIRVRDSGPGIDAEAQTRMFDPWVRGDRDGSEVNGSGLGLYLCQTIMSGLQGSLVYSAHGEEGSCFDLKLPRVLSTHNRQPVPAVSVLLRSVVCVLSLPDGLRSSLVSILLRLGVSRVVIAREELAELPESDCIVEISDRCPLPSAGRQHGVLFIAAGECGVDPRTIRSRWLPFPILESTVGPLLMELAFEHRIARAAKTRINPATDETQDSVRKRR
jgi:hypothetical protein